MAPNQYAVSKEQTPKPAPHHDAQSHIVSNENEDPIEPLDESTRKQWLRDRTYAGPGEERHTWAATAGLLSDSAKEQIFRYLEGERYEGNARLETTRLPLDESTRDQLFSDLNHQGSEEGPYTWSASLKVPLEASMKEEIFRCLENGRALTPPKMPAQDHEAFRQAATSSYETNRAPTSADADADSSSSGQATTPCPSPANEITDPPWVITRLLSIFDTDDASARGPAPPSRRFGSKGYAKYLTPQATGRVEVGKFTAILLESLQKEDLRTQEKFIESMFRYMRRPGVIKRLNAREDYQAMLNSELRVHMEPILKRLAPIISARDSVE